MFIKIKDEIIIGIYCGDKDKIFLEAGEILEEVPDTFEGQVGFSKKLFNQDWTIKLNSILVKEGLLNLSETEKLVGEIIENKNTLELMEEGLIEIPFGQKLVDGELRDKSRDEMYKDGEITIEDYNSFQKMSRKTAYQEEADPLFFDYQKEKIEKQIWLDKISEIKSRYPYEPGE